MNEPAIKVTGLAKSFTSPTGERRLVLDGLDLEVEQGEFICILGPTGCGKTTLLRLLTGLETKDEGEIRINGVAGPAPVGLVFQQNSLLPWRRVLANVTFPLELRGESRDSARRTARELLALVRLNGVERSYPFELSGGMQQRAAIARALATGSGVLLFDEPFGALDDQTRIHLQVALLDIWKQRAATVVFVTHNIEEALVLADRVLVLGGGRIIADERVEAMRPRDRFSADFVESLVKLRRLFADAVSPNPET